MQSEQLQEADIAKNFVKFNGIIFILKPLTNVEE